jgi:hypothetical protein
MANPPHIDPPRPPLYEPVKHLKLPNYNLGSLNGIPETRTAYLRGELEMRQFHTTLLGQQLSAQERARAMCALRNAIRSWTRDLMHNRADAELLTRYEQNLSFDALFAQKRAEVNTDDEAYEAMIVSATKSRPSVNGEIDPNNPPALWPVWPSFPIWGQPTVPYPPPKPPRSPGRNYEL